MDLYFSPLAGSLAARIALYEAGADARFIEVDPETKRTSDGSDFAEIHPLGLVPLLRLDDGSLLSENAAVLQYIANRFPESNLAPTDELARARLQQWLSFIGTLPSASGFDRLAPKLPHSSRPAPPGSKPLAEGPPSRARENGSEKVNAAPILSRFNRARDRPDSKNQEREHHLRQRWRAAAEDARLGPRLGPPSQDPTPRSGAEDQQAAASPSGSIGGLHSPRAASGARTPKDKEHGRASLKCQSTHTPQLPSASGFDLLAPKLPHSSRPAPPGSNRVVPLPTR
jgi:glutathione S-transferase